MIIKNNSGFTIIEVVAVLIVISIITAFAVGRVADNKPELIAQKEVLKVHLRYAQSRSMNSNDNYGIESNGNTYWLFRVSSANRVNFPGEQLDHIDLAALGLSLAMTDGSIVCFNSKGVPYTDFDTDNAGNLQTVDRTLTLSSVSDNESIIITKNTGFIQ
ncbi:MAG: type II secretion system protein [Thermodesulfobacteriota bacterium]|nr:type II secretion system protein [Thermodesulfobacteriota bacterium]